MRPRWFPPQLSKAQDLHPLESWLIPVRHIFSTRCRHAPLPPAGTLVPMERRRRGFERAGSTGPALGTLSASRRHELRCHAAWLAVSGQAIARQTRLIEMRRGRLRVGVRETRWVATLVDCMPLLAARLSARDRRLRIRTWQLESEDGALIAEGDPAAPAALESLEAAHSSVAGRRPRAAGRNGEPQPADEGSDLSRERLERVMDRYLDRSRTPASAQKP